MVVYIPWPAEPYLVGTGMIQDMRQNIPQASQPVWLTDHEGVHRQAENQRLVLALAYLFVKMCRHHAGKIIGSVPTAELSR